MSRPVIREGIRFKPIKKGNVPGATKFNEVQAGVEALLNMTVIASTRNKLTAANKNSTLEYIPSAAVGTTSSNAPFAILQPNIGTANWNIIQVNQGITTVRIYPIPALIGTAPFSLIGGQSFSGRYALTGANTDIVLNPGIANTYAVWATFDPSLDGGNGLVILYVGTDDSADTIPFSPQFPFEDDNHFIIGAITVNPASTTLTVYQMRDSNMDLLSSCVSTSGFAPARPLIFEGTLAAAGVTYRVNSSIGLGTVGVGFPADGLYIYSGTGTGVGPDTAWTRLA